MSGVAHPLDASNGDEGIDWIRLRPIADPCMRSSVGKFVFFVVGWMVGFQCTTHTHTGETVARKYGGCRVWVSRLRLGLFKVRVRFILNVRVGCS